MNEVLSQYCFLYKQLAENCGPDGSDIENWVKQMLEMMQEMIEEYIKTAMDESTTS
jgi:hypothetical protein